MKVFENVSTIFTDLRTDIFWLFFEPLLCFLKNVRELTDLRSETSTNKTVVHLTSVL